MDPINIRFVISQLGENEISTLKSGEPVISKMILSPEDHRLFRYAEGDSIEIETAHGNRLWCTITHLETISDPERVILIFSLLPEIKKGHEYS
jgi:hypothetical protein